jgi:hypothetical protein
MENKVSLETDLYACMSGQLVQQDAEIQSHIKFPWDRQTRTSVTNININCSNIIIIFFKASLRALHKLVAHGIRTSGLIIIYFQTKTYTIFWLSWHILAYHLSTDIYLSIYLPTYLPTYLLTYLPTYPATYTPVALQSFCWSLTFFSVS